MVRSFLDQFPRFAQIWAAGLTGGNSEQIKVTTHQSNQLWPFQKTKLRAAHQELPDGVWTAGLMQDFCAVMQ
jgi:hypothetical protein